MTKLDKNKIYGMALIAIGFVPLLIDANISGLILFGGLGFALIRSKGDWIS